MSRRNRSRRLKNPSAIILTVKNSLSVIMAKPVMGTIITIPTNHASPPDSAAAANGRARMVKRILVWVMDDGGSISPASPSLPKPAGIPEGWTTRPADNGNGTKYTDPDNTGNEVRVMQGRSSSNFPTSRQPYVRWMNNGQWLDRSGNVSSNKAETHIPLDEFEFDPEIFP